MRKARLTLISFSALATLLITLSFRAIKRVGVIVYTTQNYNVTATKTLTRAATAIIFGDRHYYTFVDNKKAILLTRLTTDD